MSTYTNSQDIVFLNDKNIVHNISDDKTNAIASQSLAISLSNTVANTYVSAADAIMTDAKASTLSAHDLTAVDASLSNASLSNATAVNMNVDAGVVENCNISTLNVNNLSSNGTIQANALNITGNASTGNVNVANVNATNQISVSGDALVASSDGNVIAKKLSAETLSIKNTLTVSNKITADNYGLTANGTLSANDIIANGSLVLKNYLTANSTRLKVSADISSLTATTNNLTAVNSHISALTATSIHSTDVTATQINNGSLTISNSCVIADTLTANSTGLSTNKSLSVKLNAFAENLSVKTISATTEKLANDLSVGGKIVLGDNSDFNITKDSDKICINTTGNSDPQLYINGQKFSTYFADYLSDGYIETIETTMSGSPQIRGLKFTWNLSAPSTAGALQDANGRRVTFIPLSALGGIYDSGDNIIQIDKSNANSFTINANTAAISSAISEALSDAFELADVKEAIANKVLLQEGNGEPQQISSLKIKTLGATEYSALTPQNDTIYVLTGNDMNVFNSKIVNVGAPQNDNDAANKVYVDNAISSLTIENDSNSKKILLKAGSTQLAEFSTTDFIKDGFLQSVTIADDTLGKKSLKFVWNADADDLTTYVPLTDIAKPYVGDGTYITISNVENAPNLSITLSPNAVSSAIKTAMYNDFQNELTNTTTGILYTKQQVDGISLSLSNAVANNYAVATAYVSKTELSGDTNSYISSLMSNYAPASISNTISNTYVSVSQFNDFTTSATNKTGIFNSYADKESYVSKDELCNTGLTAYYTKDNFDNPTTGILKNYIKLKNQKDKEKNI